MTAARRVSMLIASSTVAAGTGRLCAQEAAVRRRGRSGTGRSGRGRFGAAAHTGEEVEHQGVELLGALNVYAWRRVRHDAELGAADALRDLFRLPLRDEQVVLARDHVRRHRQRAEAVARVVAGAGVELAQEGVAR